MECNKSELLDQVSNWNYSVGKDSGSCNARDVATKSRSKSKVFPIMAVPQYRSLYKPAGTIAPFDEATRNSFLRVLPVTNTGVQK